MAAPSSTPFILLLALFLLSFSPSHLSSAQMAANTISAAPALLPTLPPLSSSSSSSPASSPDITPLFPSPGKGDLSPTESSLPTIPSNPSPPNPDDIPSYGPNTMAIEPSASLPLASSVSWNSGIGTAVMSLGAIVFHFGYLAFQGKFRIMIKSSLVHYCPNASVGLHMTIRMLWAIVFLHDINAPPTDEKFSNNILLGVKILGLDDMMMILIRKNIKNMAKNTWEMNVYRGTAVSQRNQNHGQSQKTQSSCHMISLILSSSVKSGIWIRVKGMMSMESSGGFRCQI
ncbi:hypothetical protein LXL04_001111 [Taraxacum kok-saghyz]